MLQRIHKHKIDYGFNDIYSYFKQVSKNNNKISKTTFKKVWEDFVKDFLIENTLKNREGYIPYNGSLLIRSQKSKIRLNKDGTVNTKYLKINFKATNELWAKNPEAKAEKKKIYFLNLHSDRVYYSWHWNYKLGLKFKGYSSCGLTLARDFSRRLPKKIFENGGIL